MKNLTKRMFAFLGAVVLLFGLIATLTGCNSSKKQCEYYEDAFCKFLAMEHPDMDLTNFEFSGLSMSSGHIGGGVFGYLSFVRVRDNTSPDLTNSLFIQISDFPVTDEDILSWYDRLPNRDAGNISTTQPYPPQRTLAIDPKKLRDYEIKAELYELFFDAYLQNHPELQDEFN